MATLENERLRLVLFGVIELDLFLLRLGLGFDEVAVLVEKLVDHPPVWAVRWVVVLPQRDSLAAHSEQRTQLGLR